MGMGAPSLGVTFDLSLAEAGSVSGGPRWEAVSVWKLLIVWRWICSTHAGSGLWGVVECHCWCTISIVCGLQLGFRWSVKISWRFVRNSMVLLWVCSGPTLSAQLLVH